MKGNRRYVDGVAQRHDFKHEREILVGTEFPLPVSLAVRNSGLPQIPRSTPAAVIFLSAGSQETLPMTTLSPAWNIRWLFSARRDSGSGPR